MTPTPLNLSDAELEEFLAERQAEKCLRTKTRPEDWGLVLSDGSPIPKDDRQHRIDQRATEIMATRSIKH